MNMSFFKLDGLSKTYFESGALMSEMHYKDGVQEGKTKEYYESGRVKADLNYKNDNLDGVNKRYYESGTVMEEELWKDGQAQYKKVFSPEGNIKEDWDYTAGGGEVIAMVKYYDKSGKLLREQPVKKKKKRAQKAKKKK